MSPTSWWMKMTDNLPTIREISEEVKALKVKPTRLVEEVVERIHRLDEKLRAFIHVAEDKALRDAEKLEQELEEGRWRGPLHGIPVAVKDVFYTRDMPTTAGSKILGNFKPSFDADAVKRLREAGAVIIGKTNMHEFAFGVTNRNPHYGVTRNPWDTGRLSGGSSGGSAIAVATGMSFAALGTDTAGSVRIPAALCGVVGLKPSYGLISRRGVIPLAWTLDHVGVLTRSVWDAALMLDILSGAKVRRELGSRDREYRVGVPRKLVEKWVAPEVEEVFWKAVERLGCAVVDVEASWMTSLSSARYIIVLSESAAYHLNWLRSRWHDYDPEVRERIAQGLLIPAAIYLHAQRVRRRLRKVFLKEMEGLDFLILPTVPVEAPGLQDEEVEVKGRELGVRRALLLLTEPFNSLGAPAISVPCGFTENGLPVGLQLVSRIGEDSHLLAFAAQVEETLGRFTYPIK